MNTEYVNLSEESRVKTAMNDALMDFNINAECINVSVNKHLAFLDLKLREGSSGSSDLSKIERRVKDFSLRIRSKTVPIVKIIPESGIIRMQVSLRQAESQNLEDLYRNYTIPSDKNMMLPFILGESDEGERLVIDFAKNPHTLIAGATSSGKSVLLHNIIANMIYLSTCNARDIQLYLVDPKQVEFVAYEGDLFKKCVTNVISSYDDTIELMSFLKKEMESRYSLLRKWGYRSIEECPRALSQIVVVIDEVADLMMQDKKIKMFESSVISLAQKARAAGIHLIMATQRPSTDVITGLIKANFPARIACKTASPIDSRVIMDCIGAENLMGRGDAILNNMNYHKVRFQVAFSDPKVTEKYLSKINDV